MMYYGRFSEIPADDDVVRNNAESITQLPALISRTYYD